MERLKNILGPMIRNGIINHQHKGLMANFNILKTIIQNHIATEHSLLHVREKETYDGQNDQLQAHYEQHKEFLQKVIQLEKDLDKHIKLYDYIHLHRL